MKLTVSEVTVLVGHGQRDLVGRRPIELRIGVRVGAGRIVGGAGLEAVVDFRERAGRRMEIDAAEARMRGRHCDRELVVRTGVSVADDEIVDGIRIVLGDVLDVEAVGVDHRAAATAGRRRYAGADAGDVMRHRRSAADTVRGEIDGLRRAFGRDVAGIGCRRAHGRRARPARRRSPRQARSGSACRGRAPARSYR